MMPDEAAARSSWRLRVSTILPKLSPMNAPTTNVGGEVVTEGDAGDGDERCHAVGQPGNPGVLLPVHPGEDAGGGERAGCVA